MSLPSKLTSYFSAERPVVAAVAPDSEAARELANSGAGVIARPDDPAAMLDAIRKMVDDPDLSTRLGHRGRAWAREMLSAEAALRGYEDFVSALLLAPQRPSCVANTPTHTRDAIEERRAA
jgi:glycosyltransferase involved in cell wall biosynthesis